MRRSSISSLIALVLCIPLATGGLGCQRLRNLFDKMREREPEVDKKAGIKANAERLAKELANAHTIGEARPAALEALAWSGLRVVKDKKVVVPPVAPLVPLRIPSVVADNLALQHIDRQGYSLVQIGTMIAEHPAAGPQLAVLKDGRLLLEVLRRSLGRALNQPNDPTSFVPIYISNSIMARHHTHIQASQTKPEEITLTTLDLLMWSAAHRRSGVHPKKVAPGKRASLRDLFVPPAYAKGGPCDWIQDEFGDEMSEFVKGEITTIAGGALDAGWEAVLDKLGGAARDAADKGMKGMGMALSWVTMLVSLVGMYGGYSIKVDPDPSKTHMCHPDGEGGPPPGQKVHFIAKVSSKPIMDDRLQRCLDLMGVDLPNEDSAKNCKVRWSAGPQFDKFGMFDADGLAQAGYGLGRLEQFVGENGEAKVQVTIKDEKQEAEKNGKKTQGSLIVNCELFTQKANGAKMAMAVVTRSIADPLKQWIDKAFPQSARGTMAIEYHTIKKVKCEKNFTKGGMNYVLKAAPKGDGGLYGPWDGTLTGTITKQGITGKFDATMSFDIPENGEGQVTGTHSYKSSFNKIVLTTDLVINGDLKGTARIGDPDGAAKLILRVGGMNTKLAAKGRGIQGERIDYNKTSSGGGDAEFVCELQEE